MAKNGRLPVNGSWQSFNNSSTASASAISTWRILNPTGSVIGGCSKTNIIYLREGGEKRKVKSERLVLLTSHFLLLTYFVIISRPDLKTIW